MSTKTTFIDGGVIVNTNPAAPVAIYGNQTPKTVSIIDLFVVPTGAPITLQPVVYNQISGQRFYWKPTLTADGFFEIRNIVVPYVSVIRAYGGSYSVRYSGLDQNTDPQPGRPNYLAHNILEESHPARPDGTKGIILVTPKTFGVVMDEFLNNGINTATTVPARASLKISGVTSDGRAFSYYLFKDRVVDGYSENRKLIIPPNCTVEADIKGNVCALYQWAVQRFGEDKEI